MQVFDSSKPPIGFLYEIQNPENEEVKGFKTNQTRRIVMIDPLDDELRRSKRLKAYKQGQEYSEQVEEKKNENRSTKRLFGKQVTYQPKITNKNLFKKFLDS